MKFKSPGDEPIYVALLSGHSAVVTDEWRELPVMLHREALMAGCITDNMSAEAIAAKIESAQTGKSNHEILVETIKGMMDNPQSGYFTGADLPNLKVLSGLAGWTVNKEEMMQAVQEIANEPEVEGDAA